MAEDRYDAIKRVLVTHDNPLAALPYKGNTAVASRGRRTRERGGPHAGTAHVTRAAVGAHIRAPVTGGHRLRSAGT